MSDKVTMRSCANADQSQTARRKVGQIVIRYLFLRKTTARIIFDDGYLYLHSYVMLVVSK